MQRIQAEQLAGGRDGRRDRDGRLLEDDADAGGLRDLVEGGGEAAAGGVAHRVQRAAGGVHHRADQAVQGAGVRGDVGLEAQPFPHTEHGGAVQADRARQQQGVTGPRARGGHRRAGQPAADPRGRHEDAIRRSLTHHLGVARDHRHARLQRGPCDRRGDSPQVVDGEPFLDHQRQCQRQRLGAHHGDVVDGTVDGQRPDVAAGEEQRVDHERIGAHDQVQAGDRDDRGVLQRAAGGGPAEGGEQHVAEQRRRQLTAGAVPEQHPLGLRVRRGAGGGERVERGHDGTSTTGRARPAL